MKCLKTLLIAILLLGFLVNVQANSTKTYPRYGVVVTKVYKPRVVVHKGTNYFYSNGIWYTAYGRKYRISRAPIGIKISFIPRGYKIVRHHGKKYYLHNGIWYVKKKGYYTVVRVS